MTNRHKPVGRMRTLAEAQELRRSVLEANARADVRRATLNLEATALFQRLVLACGSTAEATADWNAIAAKHTPLKAGRPTNSRQYDLETPMSMYDAIVQASAAGAISPQHPDQIARQVAEMLYSEQTARRLQGEHVKHGSSVDSIAKRIRRAVQARSSQREAMLAALDKPEGDGGLSPWGSYEEMRRDILAAYPEQDTSGQK